MAPNLHEHATQPPCSESDTAETTENMMMGQVANKKDMQPARFHSYSNGMHRRRELRLWITKAEPWCRRSDRPGSPASFRCTIIVDEPIASPPQEEESDDSDYEIPKKRRSSSFRGPALKDKPVQQDIPSCKAIAKD
ncbi:uncharacterized protein LOC118517441 [Anopheles stephensi]|uniref:uncharacterized protein LOC118517441 n=1 Tax=Anopheles stephensi TaxID=30069 RepID=UPI001658AC8E|nr:uncharacterized protein LOC118517441 [Anopheles stephensi]XP_035919464.1 uncharacterized protein LOC118517441 [Anopheles stephensi]